MTQTLYDILGVARTATQEEIKHAYRTLSKIAHPDAGGDAQVFATLSNAYEVLSDPERRARYDATGETEAQRPVEADARDFIAQIIAQGIEALSSTSVMGESIPFDFWAMVRKSVQEEERSTNKTIAQMTKRHRLLRQAHEKLKLKSPSDNDHIRPMIDHMARAISRNLEQAKRRSEMIKAAFVVVDSYEFNGGQAPQHQAFRHIPMGTSATGAW